MVGFKKKDQDLFLKIASAIKASPGNYREAGEWLDLYYDNNELYAEKQKEIDQQKHQLAKEIEELEQKIQIEKLNGVSAFNGKLHNLEGELFTKTQRLEFLGEFETKQQPPIKERLAYALEDLFSDYKHGGTLSQIDAAAILLITWVVTDAEANKANPNNLTKFANIPWKAKSKSELTRHRHSLAPFLFKTLDIALHYHYQYRESQPIYELDLNYLPMICSAWNKLKAIKECQTKEDNALDKKHATAKKPLQQTYQGKEVDRLVVNFRRNFGGILRELFNAVLDEKKRFDTILAKFPYKSSKEELQKQPLPAPLESFYVKSIETLNEIGKSYSAQSEEEIVLCKKLAEHNGVAVGIDFIEGTNRVKYTVHEPVKQFIDKYYADIIAVNKQYRKEDGEEANCDVLRKLNLSQKKKATLESLQKVFEDGANKYPRLIHLVLEWPLFACMPKPPRDMLSFCDQQEYDRMLERRKTVFFGPVAGFSGAETQSTYWFLYPKGESWNKDSGIKRFRDLLIDAHNLLGCDWLKLLHEHIKLREPWHENSDGWDGLFDEDYDFNEEGYRRGLYKDYYITDVFYESVRLCRKLLDSETEQKTKSVKKTKAKKAKQPENKYTPWTNSGDACFIIEGDRIKFHYDEQIKDLRFRNNSNTPNLLFLLSSGSLQASEIQQKLCPNTTNKASKIVDYANKILNEKVAKLGFVNIPPNVEFIGCDSFGSYILFLKFHTKDKFERLQRQEPLEDNRWQKNLDEDE